MSSGNDIDIGSCSDAAGNNEVADSCDSAENCDHEESFNLQPSAYSSLLTSLPHVKIPILVVQLGSSAANSIANAYFDDLFFSLTENLSSIPFSHFTPDPNNRFLASAASDVNK